MKLRIDLGVGLFRYASLMGYVVFCLGGNAQALSHCGGEGPQPFHSTADAIDEGPAPVRTRGNVEQFLLRERSDSLIYRTDNAGLYLQSAGYDRFLGNLSANLLPVPDTGERFLVAADSNGDYLLRAPAQSSAWWRVPLRGRDIRPLFWDGGVLHWLKEEKRSGTQTGLTVYRSGPGVSALRQTCTVNWPDAGFRVAGADRFPNILVYHSDPASSAPDLNVYWLNVRDCRFTALRTYKQPLPGPVESIFRFSPTTWAVHFDHPTRNLLWDYGTGCEYVEIGDRTPIAPHPDVPALVTWDVQDGMRLWKLPTRESMDVFPGGSYRAPAVSDVQLSSATGALYFALRHRDGTKRLWKADVGSFLFR